MSDTPTLAADAIRVLIVDDEPELTELLSVAVTAAGRRPFVARDGYGALRTARRHSPHAVVLDGMLPDLDGIQVLRRLRYENARLPVLMLTARDAVEYRLDGLSSGADDYGGNLVEVYVYGLRAKIDRERRPMIHTVRGAGYVLRPADDEA
ncbi:response regulator [Streptomyces sp. NPDC002677]|uniref:response regulator n=1 Tax=Streptomyces sp. NPDC002677 TaxID=3154774 RepID=UPI0033294C39